MIFRSVLIVFLMYFFCSLPLSANTAYKYIPTSQIGGNANLNGVIYKERFYALGRSSMKLYGAFIDVYQLDSPVPEQTRRRILLDNESNLMSLSDDFLLLQHQDGVTVMRITEHAEEVVGYIKVNAAYRGAFHAAIHNKKIVIRKTFFAGPTDIEVYDVGSTLTLSKTLTYTSGGMSHTIVLDDNFIYLRDRQSTSTSNMLLHTFNLKNYDYNSVSIENFPESFTYAGNGYFIYSTFDRPKPVLSVYKYSERGINKIYPLDTTSHQVLHSSNNILYLKSTDNKQLCSMVLTEEAANSKNCTEVTDIQWYNRVAISEGKFIFINNNEFQYFNMHSNSKTPISINNESSIFQFGWIDDDLIAVTDLGYKKVDNTNKSLHNIPQENLPFSSVEIMFPLIISDRNLIRAKVENTSRLRVFKHEYMDGSINEIESFTINLDKERITLNDILSERYYVNINNEISIYDILYKGEKIKTLSDRQLKSANGHILKDDNEIHSKSIHKSRILYGHHSSIYYFSIESTHQNPVLTIDNVDKFDTNDDYLFAAFNNTLRKYQWINDQYVQIASDTFSKCHPTIKPTSLNINGDKAFIVKQWSSNLVPKKRNFLCIYDISNPTMKFETQLELPTAASGAGLFKIKGKDLYGIVENDGRLFHYQQNFAPEFATSVTVNEDSITHPLLLLQDVENDNLSVELTKAASQGSASVINQQISYAPKANFHGTDLITVKVTDTAANVTEQDIAITIKPINDAPVAEALQFSVVQNAYFSGQLKATDVDGDKLNFVVVNPPKLGTLTLNTDGSFGYQATQSGDDRFEFKVIDNYGGEHKAMVSISVTTGNGSTNQPQKTESSGGGGSFSFGALLLLSLLAVHRRKVNS